MADGTEVVEVGGPPENPERYQRLKKSLGKGAFKTVYEAFDTVDSKSVAWNQVDRGNLDGKKYEEFRNEVLQLSKLDHRHIIKLTDWWESKDNQHVVFITELMSSGDLKKFMKTRKVNMKTMRRWARQILEALHYLHTNFEHPIVHRDIKCDNIFINGNLGELKLGDLGLCTMMTQTHAASVLGTPEFMAPEMYGEMYNQKVDIYAFGMCILEIFTGQYPYEECSNPGQIFMKVAKSIPPKALVTMENVAVKHFIESCLAPVEERPTARELLDHELLIDLAEPLADQDPAPQGGVFTPISGPVTAAAHVTAMPSIEAAAAGSFQTEQRVHLAEAAAAQARQSGLGVPENRETAAADIGVQPRTGGSLDDTGSTGTFVEIKIVDARIANRAADGVGVIITINVAIDGKGKKIQFEFNLQHDQATEVASDLVEEILKDRGASMPSNQDQRNHFIKNLKEQFTESIEETVRDWRQNASPPVLHREPISGTRSVSQNPVVVDAEGSATGPPAVPVSAGPVSAGPAQAAMPVTALPAMTSVPGMAALQVVQGVQTAQPFVPHPPPTAQQPAAVLPAGGMSAPRISPRMSQPGPPHTTHTTHAVPPPTLASNHTAPASLFSGTSASAAAASAAPSPLVGAAAHLAAHLAASAHTSGAPAGAPAVQPADSAGITQPAGNPVTGNPVSATAANAQAGAHHGAADGGAGGALDATQHTHTHPPTHTQLAVHDTASPMNPPAAAAAGAAAWHTTPALSLDVGAAAESRPPEPADIKLDPAADIELENWFQSEQLAATQWFDKENLQLQQTYQSEQLRIKQEHDKREAKVKSEFELKQQQLLKDYQARKAVGINAAAAINAAADAVRTPAPALHQEQHPPPQRPATLPVAGEEYPPPRLPSGGLPPQDHSGASRVIRGRLAEQHKRDPSSRHSWARSQRPPCLPVGLTPGDPRSPGRIAECQFDTGVPRDAAGCVCCCV